MAKYIIVGGVAAGMSAAARLRRCDESAEIIVFERGGYVSYANCGLPYYVGDEITNRDSLLLQTPESFKIRFNVDVKIFHEVIEVYPERKTVKVLNLKSNETTEESYDALLLTPGGSPLKPPLPGFDHPRVKTLWTIPDTDTIRTMVDEGGVKKAVVVGGGFIGLEMAENLRLRGIDVTLVEMTSQVMNLLDFEMAAYVRRELLKNGIKLHLDASVTAFEERHGGGVMAILSTGVALEADMVLLSIGVKPNTAFLAGSGILLGKRGHILVDKYLRTNLQNIYAAGDAIEVLNPLTGKSGAVPLAGPANKQGRIAADVMCGNLSRSYDGTIGTAIAKVFDRTVGMTGLTEKVCRAEGIKYQTVMTHINHHAAYYPGATPISMKLLFSTENRTVLGAQAVGMEGVDKRIDLIATAIKGGMTVDDLTEIEHSYAPPYSSAKDPVNMLGFMAQNVLDGLVKSITWDMVDKEVSEGAILLDVRTPMEVSAGTIPGSITIPLDSLRSRINEVPKGLKIIVFCKIGLRGYIACRILKGYGIDNCANLSGGYDTWFAAKGA